MTDEVGIHPAIGEPPAVQFIAVDRLAIDPAYQRSTASAGSQKLIAAMAERWDWRLCVPLLVSAREGRLFIIDGQHRWSAAKVRGDVPFLPCAVGTFSSAREEAALFVAANRRRVPMTQVDLFRAAVAAGDPVATVVERLLGEAGLVLATGGGVSAKAGELNCPRALLQLGEKSPEILGTALRAIGQAFAGHVIQFGAPLVRATCMAVGRRSDLSAEQVSAALGSRAPDDWLRIPAVREAIGAMRDLELRRAIEAKLPAAELVPDNPATAAQKDLPKPTFLKPAETDWCTQCDQRRSGAQAARCLSAFCKLKVAA